MSRGPRVQDITQSRTSSELATDASSAVDCRPRAATAGSPTKHLSPADISGANEEWETASEGSDGGVHARRQTTHRATDAVNYSTVEGIAESVKAATGVDRDCGSCSRGGRAANPSTQHSPCASGVPSLAAGTDVELSWKDSAAGSYRHGRDMSGGNSVSQQQQQHELSAVGCSRTDSADIAVIHLGTAPSVAPPHSSRLLTETFTDPATKQPLCHDALDRYVHTGSHHCCVTDRQTD